MLTEAHEIETFQNGSNPSPVGVSSMATVTDKKFECEICHKHFTQRGSLKLHMLTHTKEKTHACAVCAKRFTLRSHLKLHMLTHSDEKPHQCEQCHKSFARKHSLQLHLFTHTREKTQVCQVCHKTFALKSHLRLHMFTHTKERPHTCATCGKNFAQRSTLNKHMVTHMAQKPHLCAICEKRFTLKHHLQLHILTHTKEKPHGCLECGRGFAQKSSLKVHMLTHAKEKLNDCKECVAHGERKTMLAFHMSGHRVLERVDSNMDAAFDKPIDVNVGGGVKQELEHVDTNYCYDGFDKSPILPTILLQQTLMPACNSDDQIQYVYEEKIVDAKDNSTCNVDWTVQKNKDADVHLDNYNIPLGFYYNDAMQLVQDSVQFIQTQDTLVQQSIPVHMIPLDREQEFWIKDGVAVAPVNQYRVKVEDVTKDHEWSQFLPTFDIKTEID